MNSRERVIAALTLKQPDRVPVIEFLIHEKIAKMADPEAKDIADFSDRNGMDVVQCVADIRKIWKDGPYCVDEWGVTYKDNGETTLHPIKGPIQSWDDLKAFKPMDPDAPYRLGKLPELVQRYKGKRAICFHHRDSFMWTAYLMGFENLLVSFYDDPDLVETVMDMVLDVNIKIARRAARAGAEIFLLGDDYANNQGPIMSPAIFKRYILPRLKKMVDVIHEEGAYVIKHSDGYLWPLLDMIVDTGVNAINPIDPVAGMDIAEVKQKYGNKVCIVGNIDCGELLTNGSPAQVEEAVKNCIREAAPGGGFMLSSSNCIHSGVKPENLLTMINSTTKYGKYPLSL